MNNIEVFINTLAAQAQHATSKPSFRITVTHKIETELVIEEELRRKKIKSLQRKNKKNRRRKK